MATAQALALSEASNEGSTLTLEQGIAHVIEEDVDGRVDGGMDTPGH